VLVIKLGRRLDDGVRAKASELGVSLRPTNRSPYNRKKQGLGKSDLIDRACVFDTTLGKAHFCHY
jgi:hypothetical protein